MKVILCLEHYEQVVHRRGEHSQGTLNGAQHDQAQELRTDYNDWSTAVLNKALKTGEEVGTNVEIVFLIVYDFIYVI